MDEAFLYLKLANFFIVVKKQGGTDRYKVANFLLYSLFLSKEAKCRRENWLSSIVPM